MKVLVIDDSKFQCLAIQRALGHMGFQVITALDGENGVKIARQELPNVIFLDMMLPKLSGPDVLRALRQDAKTSGIPVIALTALSERNRDKLMEEGAAGFVEKSEALIQGDCEALRREIARATAASRR